MSSGEVVQPGLAVEPPAARDSGWYRFASSAKRMLLAIIVGGVLGCWVAVARASDWPMGRGNPQGTGASEEELPQDLELLWQIELGGLGFDAGPIVVQGTVYACDAEGRIVAASLHDGTIRWQKKLDAGFVASPGYHDGTVYVGDYDGNFHALDAGTGEEKWIFQAGSEIDATPNFFDNSVLFTAQNGALYSVDCKSGRLKWKYETEDQLQSSPTLAGTLTWLGGCDGNLHVVDVRTGQAAAEPIPIDGPTGSTPAIVDQRVYVPTYAGDIFCFQVGQREPVWRFRDPELADEFRNSAAVARGLVVAATRRKRVFALDAQNGTVRWVHVLRKRADASPVIAGSSVIVAAADGRIIRLNLETGKQIWMTEVKGAFLGSPAIADQRLVLASDRGTLFCFGKKSEQ